MQIRFSPTSRLIYFLITMACVWGLLQASLVWSRNETKEFLEYIVGKQSAGTIANVIQFAPNIFLVLATNLKLTKRWWWIMIGLVIMFNLMDFWTNEVAFAMSLEQNTVCIPDAAILSIACAPEPLRPAIEAFGYLAAFLVTWAEEPLALLMGFGVFLLGEILNDFFGFKMPRWASKDIVDLLVGASGAKVVGLD